jgi:hypothetical protein
MARVRWRGVLLDSRTADMMEEVATALTGPVYVKPTQGSYSGGVSASAGTHNGGGAIDIAAAQLKPAERQVIVKAMRQVGFAAWLRTPEQANWPYHIHGVAVQPKGKNDRGVLSYAAHRQVINYYENKNGLASGKPDDGPRQYVGTTWEKYRASQTGGQTVGWYKYSGKPSGTLKLKPGVYTRVDVTIPPPPADGVEHRMLYANVTPAWKLPPSDPGYKAQRAVLRVRWTRKLTGSSDNTAYQSYVVVPGDPFLLTHLHWEMGEKGVGGFWSIRIDGDVTGGSIGTRYSKGFM